MTKRSFLVAVIAVLFLAAVLNYANEPSRHGKTNTATVHGEVLDSDSYFISRVSINANETYQRIDGFGSSARLFDDPHLTNTFNPMTRRSAVVLSAQQRDAVRDVLYKDLGLSRIRPASPDTKANSEIQEGIEPVNDNADPYVTDLSKFDFRWKNLDGHCQEIKKAQQRGATTGFLSPLKREAWMGTHSKTDAAEYAEWLMAQVNRCAALGVRLPFLSISNEPSFRRNTMSGEFIRDVIKDIGPRLRAAGLDTRIVMPDDVRSSNAAAIAKFILADAEARSYVGALATHLYDEPLARLSEMQALSAQYQLPLWMTEFSIPLAESSQVAKTPWGWAGLIHELLATYQVSAIDYQWGFFGQWEKDTSLVELNYNPSNKYTGYTLTKQYYLTGQYSRFVRPGARRIQVKSENNKLKVTAFRMDNQLVIVALNSSNTAAKAEVRIDGVSGIASVSLVRTNQDIENWKRLETIVVRDSRFSADLPARSVTTFTGKIL